MNARQVVINADDAGADENVDAGLLRSCRRGLVRSASVLVNFGGAPAFVESARMEGMGLGLHFNITEGRPLSAGGRRLYRSGHAFRGTKAEVWHHAANGHLDPAALREEARAQWHALAALGATAHHVDSHNHVHLYPGVLDALLDALPRDRPLHIRIPWEENCPPEIEPEFAEPRPTAAAMRQKIEAAGHFAAPAFFGYRFSETPSLEGLAALEHSSAPWCEWMVHPGLRAGSPFTTSKKRKLELELLTHDETVDALRSWGWQTSTFERAHTYAQSHAFEPFGSGGRR